MIDFDPYEDEEIVTLPDLVPQDNASEHDFDVYVDFCVRCRRSYEEILEKDLQACDGGQ